ncbi:major facilitator superfamily domain-containing protein [Aspergillus affinis]|uniref:major facilitator superfamily domain-containing protein n=1 Tax=Aspergillus affinis TaxID=1070780 RepID=UPI0022FF0E02|nr:major facilitator superfamily domain-containing protein [Aspergillus affinis]KAI9043912.1 major facilitator superfamily domain-containing protein [Aspergillus affinis]
MISTMMAPAINTIAEELQMSITESTMALSVYVLATAFGPLIIGPLSEIYGRKSIFHLTNVWFLVWNLVCGFAHSKGLLISARLLAGFGASAVYTILQVVLELSSSLLFNESYAPLLLLRRLAAKLRKYTGDHRYHAEIERREPGRSPFWKL